METYVNGYNEHVEKVKIYKRGKRIEILLDVTEWFSVNPEVTLEEIKKYIEKLGIERNVPFNS